MTRPLLPPRGFFTGTRWLFDPHLSPAVKETLLQLMVLTWGRESHITPPLSYPQLEQLTGRDASTLRGHLTALRSYRAALRLQRAEPGQFIIHLSDWLFRNDCPEAAADPHLNNCENLNLPVKEEINQNQEQEDLTDSVNPVLLVNHDQSARASGAAKTARKKPAGASQPAEPKPGGKNQAGGKKPAAATQPSGKTQAAAAQVRLSEAFKTRLLESGVFPVLLQEVASRATEFGLSERELAGLLDWSTADQPDLPAPLFISRVRAGARPPAAYTDPACPRCGRRGDHASDCPRRYLNDG